MRARTLGDEGTGARGESRGGNRGGPVVDDVCRTEWPGGDKAPTTTKAAGRIDWATLMHRVWGWDVLQCARCEGRMLFIAVIQEREVVERILAHVGLSTARIVAAPARRWDDTS